MKKESTSVRLKKIMNIKNLRQVDILNLTLPYCKKYGVKMNKSDISQYCSGKTEPNQKKLFVLGCALNVNEAWLMGFDVPMERSLASEDPERISLIPVVDKIYDEFKEQQKRMDTFVQLFRLHGYTIEINENTVEISKGSKHRSLTQKEFAALQNNCYKDFVKHLNNENNEKICKVSSKFISTYEVLSPENQKKVLRYSENLLNNQQLEEELIAQAAHERTDIEVTNEMKKHDDDIMDDDDF